MSRVTALSSAGVKTPDRWQLPIYLINLDADKLRLAAMRERLDALGLPWERIPAIDGTLLPPEVLFQENRRARRRKLSAGEIGCLRSHVTAWRRVVEGSEPAALVLEDDVLLGSDTALLVQDSTWKREDLGIVRLETYGIRVVLGARIKTMHGRGLHPLRSGQHGAAAYIVTRARADELLRAYADFADTADRMMFGTPRVNHVYQFSPAPCIQCDILKYGRHDYGHSHLQLERDQMNRQSWREPLSLARRLMWKLGSIAGIGLDVVRGYALQEVPFG